MFSKQSPRFVAPLAQALTESGRVIALKSEHSPLAAACESYSNFATPNKVAYSHRLATVSQEEFVVQNQDPTVVQESDFERQSELMAQGLRSITFTTRNVIIPTINALVDAYKSRQAAAQTPMINMVVHQYAGVHNEPNLVNHVQAKYAAVQIQPEYRSFLLGERSAEAIIELVATNNPHLDQQQVTEWLLKVGSARILNVWNQLFCQTRAFSHGMLDFTHPARLPNTVDELLIAYCVCGHFIENPVDNAGESIGMEDWGVAFQGLHEYFGALLLGAYHRRVEDVKRDILVYRSQAQDPLKNLSVQVEVNGDVYPKWTDGGGRPEAVLGAAVYQSHLRNVEAINQMQDQLVTRWNQLYPLMRQAALDRTQLTRQKDYQGAFQAVFGELPDDLPQLTQEQLGLQLPQLIRGFRDSELDNPFSVYAQIVCKLFYDNPIYCEFLNAFEYYSKLHPDASPREFAVYSLIEVAASWLAQQQTVIDYTPVVDPAAVLPETVVSAEDGEMDSAAMQVASQQEQVELTYDDDQYEYTPTDEHGEMPPTKVLKEGAVPNNAPAAEPASAAPVEPVAPQTPETPTEPKAEGEEPAGEPVAEGEEEAFELPEKPETVSTESAQVATVSISDIRNAEKTLGLGFPAAYTNYLKQVGVFSGGAREFTGLGVKGHLNVVEATLAERKLAKGEVSQRFVVEAIGNGSIAWCDAQGKVAILSPTGKEQAQGSFDQYLAKAQAEAGTPATESFRAKKPQPSRVAF